jgi:UDP-N-acetylglucosamine transferase subunit ALG13
MNPMIFVTVGSELPFDRLVRIIDEWAEANHRHDVFAQIGPSKFRPAHVEFSPFLDPPEFRRRFERADIIVSHAGMGTVLTALEMGKPLLVMPRRAQLGEVRNDHQQATAEHLRERAQVHVAFGNDELRSALCDIDHLSAGGKISCFASSELVGTVRDFINEVAEQRLARRIFRNPFRLRPRVRHIA